MNQISRTSSSAGRAPVAALFSITIVVGVALRLLAASQGDNYDMESWWIVSEAIRSGDSVYAATNRYNYGPLWAYVIGGLRYLSAMSGPDTITRLHFFITSFLSLADVGLGLLLTSWGPAWLFPLFLLNPISVIVTGYHIQFDNLAILIGLVGWVRFLRGSTTRDTLIAGLIFGASLVTKHLFIVFLAWIPFLAVRRNKTQRILFAYTALKVFLLSFVPFAFEASSFEGMKRNVFQYVSTEGHSLINALNFAADTFPDRTLFMMILAVSGIALGGFGRVANEAPLCYLCALTALSSGMARNYLAIPLVAVTLWRHLPTSWIYSCVALLALVTVNPSLGVSEVVAPLSTNSHSTYELAQVALLALLLNRYMPARRGEL